MEIYQFRLEGHLDYRWREWLGNMEIKQQVDGTTLITGPVADQAALFGVLSRIRDLGTPLLSLTVLKEEPESFKETNEHHEYL